MMDCVEEMVEQVALALHGTTAVPVGAHVIDFKRPWHRMTMFEAIEHFTGMDVSGMEEEALRATAQKLHVPLEDSAGKGRIIDEIFGALCEPHLIQPTFITDYPVEMSPLAKRHRDNPALVERFEVICNGKEICNAFSELNDPIDQRQRFEEQLALGQRGDQEAMALDEDFLRALSYGMPPTVGLGIGIDRLAMIMTNSPSIQDVIFFPQMRPAPYATRLKVPTSVCHRWPRAPPATTTRSPKRHAPHVTWSNEPAGVSRRPLPTHRPPNPSRCAPRITPWIGSSVMDRSRARRRMPVLLVTRSPRATSATRAKASSRLRRTRRTSSTSTPSRRAPTNTTAPTAIVRRPSVSRATLAPRMSPRPRTGRLRASSFTLRGGSTPWRLGTTGSRRGETSTTAPPATRSRIASHAIRGSTRTRPRFEMSARGGFAPTHNPAPSATKT